MVRSRIHKGSLRKLISRLQVGGMPKRTMQTENTFLYNEFLIFIEKLGFDKREISQELFKYLKNNFNKKISNGDESNLNDKVLVLYKHIYDMWNEKESVEDTKQFVKSFLESYSDGASGSGGRQSKKARVAADDENDEEVLPAAPAPAPQCVPAPVIPNIIVNDNTLVGALGIALKSGIPDEYTYTHGFIDGLPVVPYADIHSRAIYAGEGFGGYVGWADPRFTEVGRANNTAALFAGIVANPNPLWATANILFRAIENVSRNLDNLEFRRRDIDPFTALIVNDLAGANEEATERWMRDIIALCDTAHDFTSDVRITLFDTAYADPAYAPPAVPRYFTFHSSLMHHIQQGFPLLKNMTDISKKYCFRQTYSKDESTFLKMAKYYYLYKNRGIALHPTKITCSVNNKVPAVPPFSIGNFKRIFGETTVFSIDVTKLLYKITRALEIPFVYCVWNREHIADAAPRTCVRNRDNITFLTEISSLEYIQYRAGILRRLDGGANDVDEVFQAGFNVATSVIDGIPGVPPVPVVDILAAITAARLVPLQHVGKDDFLDCVASRIVGVGADQVRILASMRANTGFEAIVSIFADGIEPRKYYAGNGFGEFPGSLMPVYEKYTTRGAVPGVADIDPFMPYKVDLTLEDIHINHLKMVYKEIVYNSIKTNTNSKPIVDAHIRHFQTMLPRTNFVAGDQPQQLMASGDAANSVEAVPGAPPGATTPFHHDATYYNSIIGQNKYGTPYNNMVRYQLTKKRTGDQAIVLACSRWIVYRRGLAGGPYTFHIIKNTTHYSFDQMAVAFAILHNINCVYEAANDIYCFPARNNPLKSFPRLPLIPAVVPPALVNPGILQFGGVNKSGAGGEMTNEEGEEENPNVDFTVNEEFNKELDTVYENINESIENPYFWLNLFRYKNISNISKSVRRNVLYDNITNMITCTSKIDNITSIIRSETYVEDAADDSTVVIPDVAPEPDNTYIVYIKTTGNGLGITKTVDLEDAMDIEYSLIEHIPGTPDNILIQITRNEILEIFKTLYYKIKGDPGDVISVIHFFELYSLINSEALETFYNLTDSNNMYSSYVSAYPELFNFILSVPEDSHKDILPFLKSVRDIPLAAGGAGGGGYSPEQKQTAASILSVLEQIYLYGSTVIFNDLYIDIVKNILNKPYTGSGTVTPQRRTQGAAESAATTQTRQPYSGFFTPSSASQMSVASFSPQSTSGASSPQRRSSPQSIEDTLVEALDNTIELLKVPNTINPLHLFNSLYKENVVRRRLSMISEETNSLNNTLSPLDKLPPGRAMNKSSTVFFGKTKGAAAAAAAAESGGSDTAFGGGKRKTRRRKHASKNRSKKARREPKKLSKRHLTRSTMSTRHLL